MGQWLGLSAFTARVQIWSLVGELRSRKTQGGGQAKKIFFSKLKVKKIVCIYCLSWFFFFFNLQWCLRKKLTHMQNNLRIHDLPSNHITRFCFWTLPCLLILSYLCSFCFFYLPSSPSLLPDTFLIWRLTSNIISLFLTWRMTSDIISFGFLRQSLTFPLIHS